MITDNLGITLLILAAGLWYFFRNQKSRNYPPSIGWGIPIAGHLLKLGKYPFKTLLDLRSTLGPIVSLNFGAFPTVAISDHKLLREVLADPKCSGRPDLPLFKVRSGGERHGILFSDGDEWVEVRRFTLRHLRDFGFGTKSMESIISVETLALLEQLKKTSGTPVRFQSFVNTAVLNSLWYILASSRFEQDDPKLNRLLDILLTTNKANIFSSLAFFNPWMAKWLPKLSGFHNTIKHVGYFQGFQLEPLKAHRATLIPGQPRDLMDVFIEETQNCKDPKSYFYGPLGERVMLTVFHDLFIAGSETTSTTMAHLALYLAANPEIQSKLYNEILTVVGKSRLPSLVDKASMVYTEAVTLEVMRICSLVPLGLFHKTVADAKIGGYDIPKDTMIVTNLYSCHFDVEYWGDPEVFRPERFLSPDGKSVIRHEALIPFSFGKRLCPGENLSRTELFLFSTAVFQKFEFAFDPENTPESLEPFPGLLRIPPNHKIIFTERT